MPPNVCVTGAVRHVVYKLVFWVRTSIFIFHHLEDLLMTSLAVTDIICIGPLTYLIIDKATSDTMFIPWDRLSPSTDVSNL